MPIAIPRPERAASPEVPAMGLQTPGLQGRGVLGNPPPCRPACRYAEASLPGWIPLGLGSTSPQLTADSNQERKERELRHSLPGPPAITAAQRLSSCRAVPMSPRPLPSLTLGLLSGQQSPRLCVCRCWQSVLQSLPRSVPRGIVSCVAWDAADLSVN